MIREDNRGVTLIELMLSMALMVIITGCLMMLMNSASKGYRTGNTQVELQKDSQDAANYLTDAILASNGATIISGSGMSGVILYHYDKEAMSDVTKSPYKVFVKKDRSLYFYSVDETAEETQVSKILDGTSEPSQEHLLCRNVELFEVTHGADLSKDPRIRYELKLEAGNPTVVYNINNEVAMRNKIVVSGSSMGI